MDDNPRMDYDPSDKRQVIGWLHAQARARRSGPKRGRPQADQVKVMVSLRLDADVLAAWRASGRGWQTRINAALRTYCSARRAAFLSASHDNADSLNRSV